MQVLISEPAASLAMAAMWPFLNTLLLPTTAFRHVTGLHTYMQGMRQG